MRFAAAAALAASFTVLTVEGQIKVIEPADLASTFAGGSIAGSTAAYGTPYYGERLTGRLVFGESKGEQYCRESDYEVPPPLDALALPNIVMVRRGQCNFVTKTRVAEKFKDAAAVIVVDSKGSNRSTEEIERVIMADDGWGGDIKIPSILISAAAGDRLIESVKSNKTDVIIELAWDIPKDGVVSMDFWMTPAAEKSIAFLQEYAPYAELLKNKLDFRPHYWIFSLPRDYKDLCIDDKALYCAFDPDVSGSVTGKDVVSESVRQMCLWEQTATPAAGQKNTGLYSAQWWDYVQKQPKACPLDGTTIENRLSEKCSLALMASIGVEVASISNCLERDTTTILERERLNHAWSPLAMRINDWRYSGPLDVEIVTRAVCAGFEQKPEECEQLLHPGHMEIEKKLKQLESERGIPKWAVAIAVVVALIIVIVFFIAYRIWVVRHLRRSLRYEVMNEVKQQMESTSNIHSDDDAKTVDSETRPKSVNNI